MYIILTSKPGQYRSEITSGVRPVESYDYMYYGNCKAHFVIAELVSSEKIIVTDETPPQVVNHIPIKFFQQYTTIEHARMQLQDLTRQGDTQVALVQA
jgi:hypothetical protein